MTYRVVYLDHVARLSGGEIALSRVLPALGDQVDPHVILGEDGPLVERLRREGVSVEVLPMDVAARDLRKDTVRPRSLDPRALTASARYVWQVRRRLRQIRPDIVHTNSLKAAFYGGLAGRLAGVPVVWHIRDRIAPDYLPGPAVRLVRATARYLPTAVVANSRSTLDTMPGLHQSAVVANTVVHDAVGYAHARVDPSERVFRVGMLGRLAPWKGQVVFLDAFARAFPDSDCQAWIVGTALFGEDDYADTLGARADRLGIADRVVFRGFREDVWGELAQIDLLVHCSLTPEPFGQVIVEGMAAGVPVIAADAGGPAEIVTDGVDGLLTAPGDVAALADAMRRLHDDPLLAQALAARGLGTAARYSPERTAAELIEVYDRVLSRPKRGMVRRGRRRGRLSSP